MSSELQNYNKEELIALVQQMEQTNQRLSQQNMKLVLLCKDKDTQLYKQELVIRKYRTRLVRYFEDMVYDPLEQQDTLPDESMPQQHASIALEGVELKRELQ